VFKGLRETR